MTNKERKTQKQTPKEKSPTSRPSMIHKITLKTPCVQRIHRRTFTDVARNLYSLNVVARLISSNDEIISELNDVVIKRLSEMEELVEAETQRIQVLRDESGIEAVPDYTDPQTYDCDVSTPLALRYLKLLRNIDEIVVLLDSLWLTEELDDKQKLQAEYLWQNRMIKLSNQFRDLYTRSRSAQKRLRAEKQQAQKAAKDAKDAKKSESDDESEAILEETDAMVEAG